MFDDATETAMIRVCSECDIPTIAAVINDGANAYRGVIPADCWSEPYMPVDELEREIAAGVCFCLDVPLM